MPAYSRNFSLLYVSYALKLGVWLSFVSFLIHRSQKTSLISIIVMHIAEQCLYHHSPWNDSVEICYFRKKKYIDTPCFYISGGQEEYVLSYEPVNQQEGL